MTATRDRAAILAALAARERAAPGDGAVKLDLALALRGMGDAGAAEHKAHEAAALLAHDARAQYVLGFMLRDRGALAQAATHLLEARRLDNDVRDPFQLAALTLHGLRRRVALDALPPPRDPGQHFGERVLQAIAAFEAGDRSRCAAALDAATRLASVVPVQAPNRAAFETYRLFLRHLLSAEPAPAAPIVGVAQVIGDSHCLTMAHRLLDVGQGFRRLEPSLVFGCMAWHLASPKPTPQAAAFDGAVADMPAGALMLACFGELDCRSTGGIFKRLRGGGGGDVESETSRLVAGYVARLRACAESRDLRVVVVVPPAAKVNDESLPASERALFRAIAPSFAAALRRDAASRGWPVVDLAAETRDAAGAVSGVHHVDTSHVLPRAFVGAAVRAGFRAA